jgi:hypothetical protein
MLFAVSLHAWIMIIVLLCACLRCALTIWIQTSARVGSEGSDEERQYEQFRKQRKSHFIRYICVLCILLAFLLFAIVAF